MVSEMAAMNGTNAFHFSFGTRYYIDDEDGTIGDNLVWDSQWINEMRPLLELGEKDHWMVIDLRPIKAMWLNRERTIPQQIKECIQGYDFMLIPSPGAETKPMYLVNN